MSTLRVERPRRRVRLLFAVGWVLTAAVTVSWSAASLGAGPHAAAPVSPRPATSRPATPRPVIPRMVTVGLATDRDSVELPCCQGALIVKAGSRSVEVRSALRVQPTAEVASPRTYRLQVAALKDEGQAERLAAWLAEHLGEPADATFDAGTDLYRVRVGRYAERARAEEMVERLAAEGRESWIVTVQGELRGAAFLLTHDAGRTSFAGRWLTIEREGGVGVQLGWGTDRGGTYRGRILLFLNDRGQLNVINEASLEDYLRGVVPKEMGPVVYPDLEALKAQAVAARSYTLRNLGEFEDEGYDICATPRCQVFGGMAAEHPLSDRAIRETAGQVLVYGGEVADALYTASCGGHTENVETIFPKKRHAYLRGVHCPERGVALLGVDLPPGTPLVEGLMAELLPVTGDGDVARAERRLRRLAELAGLPPSREALASLDRRDARRFVGSLFALDLDARLLGDAQLLGTDTEASLLLDEPPADWSADDLRLAAYLARTGLLSEPIEGDLHGEDFEEMLFQLAAYLGVLQWREVSYLSHTDGEIRVKEGSSIESVPRLPALPTFRGTEHAQWAAPLVLRPGDPLTLYLHGGELIGLVQRLDGEVPAGTPGAQVRTWHRAHSDSDLREMVAERYPGIDFESFEVLERGISGRAKRIRLNGRGGSSVEVEGLAIRWTLDLPDTLFTARRVTPRGGEPGWLFTGRGHGHGVGMCQLGAFGMGLRGKGYREILAHYYRDLELAELELADRPTPDRPTPGTASRASGGRE